MTDVAAQPFGVTTPAFDRSPLDVRGLLSRPIWKELRTFLAVAKSRSFTEAAALLHTSGPTVSREVKRLESQIGAQLVISSHSGIQLTPTGRALAIDLAELDFKLHTLSSNLERERTSVAGRVTVSVTSGLAVSFVAPAVMRLNARFPDIELDLKGQISMVDFGKNLTDIMVSLTPLQRADVTSELLGTLHLIPVVSRGYVARRGVPKIGQLEHHNFLACSYYAGPPFAKWRETSESGRIAHHCEDSLAYFSLIKSGAGVGLLGNYVLIEPSLVPLDLGIHVPLPLYAAVTTDRLRSKAVAAVFEWLLTTFRDNPMFAAELLLQPTRSAPEEDFRAFFNLPTHRP